MTASRSQQRLEAAIAELAASIIDLVEESGHQGQEPHRLLSMAEVGEVLGVSRPSAYKLINSRQLRCVKVGGRHLVPSRAVEEFVDAQSA